MTQQILRLLAAKPRTAAELADLTVDHSGGIARTMARLIGQGRAKRIDGGSGRGSRATYALKGDDQ